MGKVDLPEPLDGCRYQVEQMIPHLQHWLSATEFDRLANEEWELGVIGKSSSGAIMMMPHKPPLQTWRLILIEMVRSQLVERKEDGDDIYYRMLIDLNAKNDVVKNCPFCGHELPRANLDMYEIAEENNIIGVYSIVCPHCSAHGPEVKGFDAAVEQSGALKAWNRRLE